MIGRPPSALMTRCVWAAITWPSPLVVAAQMMTVKVSFSLLARSIASLSDSVNRPVAESGARRSRSEEHTSELQSQSNLVCRLLLEKKKNSHKTQSCRPYLIDQK